MNNDQITALAREYAEIECPDFKYKGDKEWRNDDIKSATLSNGAFLTWLSSRFCLVEKEAVRKAFADNNPEYKKTLAAKLQADDVQSLLKSLFPEIAKEVE